MPNYIKRGESVFFQFRNGKTVSKTDSDSQLRPRMFKTADKATLGVNYEDTDEVVEYAEVVHGEWEDKSWWEYRNFYVSYGCSACGCMVKPEFKCNYCPNCGAKMDGERKVNE